MGKEEEMIFDYLIIKMNCNKLQTIIDQTFDYNQYQNNHI